MLFEKIQLEKDEKIVTIVRKHWFFLAKNIFSIVLMMFVPLLAWFVLILLPTEVTARVNFETYNMHFVFLYALWLLINWMMIAYVWTDHHLDIWTVTDRRIIKIEQVGFFNRQIGSFRLEKLQDMNIQINGVIATLLDFGTIEAQTASGSHEEEFRADYLSKPRELKAIILKAADTRMKVNGMNRDSTEL